MTLFNLSCVIVARKYDFSRLSTEKVCSAVALVAGKVRYKSLSSLSISENNFRLLGFSEDPEGVGLSFSRKQDSWLAAFFACKKKL